jgi:hypothetical protein
LGIHDRVDADEHGKVIFLLSSRSPPEGTLPLVKERNMLSILKITN